MVKLAICHRFAFRNHFMPNAHVRDLQQELRLDGQVVGSFTLMLNSMVV
jgi:hypothetical protein